MYGVYSKILAVLPYQYFIAICNLVAEKLEIIYLLANKIDLKKRFFFCENLKKKREVLCKLSLALGWAGF